MSLMKYADLAQTWYDYVYFTLIAVFTHFDRPELNSVDSDHNEVSEQDLRYLSTIQQL